MQPGNIGSANRVDLSRRRPLRWLVWFVSRWFLIGGLGALLVSAGFAIRTSIFLKRSVSATGTVLRLKQKMNQQDGSINYLAVFVFVAADGHTYAVDSRVATNPPEFKVGQQVQVRYVPSNPSGARIWSFWQLWFVTFVCAVLGLFFALSGLLLVRWEPGGAT